MRHFALATIAVLLIAGPALAQTTYPEIYDLPGRTLSVDFTSVTAGMLVDSYDSDGAGFLVDSIDVDGDFHAETGWEVVGGGAGDPRVDRGSTGWEMGLRGHDKTLAQMDARDLDMAVDFANGGYTPQSNEELDTPRHFYTAPWENSVVMDASSLADGEKMEVWYTTGVAPDDSSDGWKLSVLYAELVGQSDNTCSLSFQNWGADAAATYNVTGLTGDVQIDVTADFSRDGTVLTQPDGTTPNWGTFSVDVYDDGSPVGSTGVQYVGGDVGWGNIPWNQDGRPDGKCTLRSNSVGVYKSYSETIYTYGDADMDGDVDYGENPITDPDGDAVSDLNILIGNAGTTSGAAWTDGDFDGDGDVDYGENPITQPGSDGTSDLNLLVKFAGTDLGLAVGADQSAGVAELVYNEVTGEAKIDNGGGIVWMAIYTIVGGVDEGAIDLFFTEEKASSSSDQIIFFDENGLPVGEDSIGECLLPGLDAGTELVFYYQADDVTQGEITVVPEPATMVLLGLGGAAALIRRKK